MATTDYGTRGTMPGRYGAWPAARVLAVIGGLLGLASGLLMLAGAAVVNTANLATGPGVDLLNGVVGAVGVVNVVLAILVFINAGMMMNNLRLHGGLLVLWGIIGLFFGFGMWFGAVLVIIGGILCFTMAPHAPMARRPVA